MHEKNCFRDKWEAARQMELLRWSVRQVCRPHRGRAPTKPIALLWRYEAKVKGKDVQLRARIVADGKHQGDRPEEVESPTVSRETMNLLCGIRMVINSCTRTVDCI